MQEKQELQEYKYFHIQKSGSPKNKRDGSVIIVSDYRGLPHPPPPDQYLESSTLYHGKDDKENNVEYSSGRKMEPTMLSEMGTVCEYQFL